MNEVRILPDPGTVAIADSQSSIYDPVVSPIQPEDHVANNGNNNKSVTDKVWDELNRIADPCIQLSGRDLSIVDLGLVNEVSVVNGEIIVSVTLTDVMCANSALIFQQIEKISELIPSVSDVLVVPKSYPLWTEDRLSEKARKLFNQESDVYWPNKEAPSKSLSEGPLS